MPTVDLVLALLCDDGGVPARLTARTRLTAPAPLIRYDLVTLADDPAQPAGSLLEQNLRLDPRIVRYLLEDDGLDERLLPSAKLVTPAPAELEAPAGLAALAEHGSADLLLFCHGQRGTGRRQAAAACCRQWAPAY